MRGFMGGQMRVAVLCIALVAIASGCIGSPGTQAEKQEVLISGSGSGVDILKPLAAEFEKKNPDIAIRFLAPTSTSDGIVGTGEGTLDMASLARVMKDSEKEKYPNLEEHTYVRDAMILAVNPGLDVAGLTADEIRRIHAGKITDWSGVGGPEGEIMLLIREESESSMLVLRKAILGQMNLTPKAVMLYSAGTTNKAIEDNGFAIGQASLGSIKLQGLKIKPLAIDGVAPTPAAVMSGEYTLVRDYGIAYRKKGASGAAKKFADYIFSDEAAKILAGYDFVPVPRQSKAGL